jgi:ketosteroid isomerase-like protein
MTQVSSDVTQPPSSNVERFAYFWSHPDTDLLQGSFTDDVVGHFPGDPEPVRGPDAYIARVGRFLEALPDLRIEVADYAANGNVTFIRWLARPTGPDGPVEFGGMDCIRLRDGLVAENHVAFDPALFDDAVSRATGRSP